MNLTGWVCAGGMSCLLFAQAASARPITFSNSTTVIADYREGVMAELQVFYVPQHNVSFDLGHVQFDDQGSDVKHSVSYARFNFLARRWNMAEAQANIFVWGGVGGAYLGGYTLEPDGSGAPSCGEVGGTMGRPESSICRDSLAPQHKRPFVPQAQLCWIPTTTRSAPSTPFTRRGVRLVGTSPMIPK